MKAEVEHPWAKRPMWQKRLHGFACYLVFAFAALIWPVETDRAIYDELKRQFGDE